MREESQTGEYQHLVNFPPSTSAETIQIPETNTSSVKTMTVLQSARTGTNGKETNSQNIKTVPQEVLNTEGSDGNSGGTDINVFC